MERSGISKYRLLDIVRNYINNDLESAESSYVLEVLRDVCGCTDDELKVLGFEYLIP